MRQLFTYILNRYFFFLFLLLEIISFFFVVQNNYQQAAFINSSGKLTGSVFNTFNNISGYFSLRKANDLLAEENVFLKEKLNNSFLITDTISYYSYDTLYKYINAKVISNTVNKQKNYLILNKGSAHGITKDMGVTSYGAIVGTVVDVSEHFSRVMSVLHINNKINARIKKNNHLGNVEWNGKNYQVGILTDIPAHVTITNGDTIITSGNSFIFPEGILIGTVEELYTNPGDKFNKALINFSVDYNNVYYVNVIVNLMKEEQIQLDSLRYNE